MQSYRHEQAVVFVGVKIHDKMLNFWHFLIQIRLKGDGGPMEGMRAIIAQRFPWSSLAEEASACASPLRVT